MCFGSFKGEVVFFFTTLEAKVIGTFKGCGHAQYSRNGVVSPWSSESKDRGAEFLKINY